MSEEERGKKPGRELVRGEEALRVSSEQSIPFDSYYMQMEHKSFDVVGNSSLNTPTHPPLCLKIHTILGRIILSSSTHARTIHVHVSMSGIVPSYIPPSLS